MLCGSLSDKIGVINLEGKACTKCGMFKPLSEFYKCSSMHDGKRPDCASCHTKQRREYRKANAIDVKIYDMASGILRRTSGRGRNCDAYKEIECHIGSTRDEVIEYINENFRDDIEAFHNVGKIASIDRIDSSKHYEPGNLRIIEWIENSRLGMKQAKIENSQAIRVFFPDGNCSDFVSISEAAKNLKCKRDTIYAALERPEINRRGLRFELLKKNA
jgi:hypothetical protein